MNIFYEKKKMYIVVFFIKKNVEYNINNNEILFSIKKIIYIFFILRKINIFFKNMILRKKKNKINIIRMKIVKKKFI